MNQTGLQPNDPSDDFLWKLMLQGDSASFESLMAEHTQSLFQYGLKYTSDPEFVKDTIQDLFLYIWAHRTTLSSDIAVRPYLMASLRRMMHRSSSKKSLINNNEEDSTFEFEVEFSVEQKYIRQESTMLLVKKIKKNLEELPSRQKEVIYLKFYQNLSREQISEVMEITPQTVSNLLQIAIKQLRKYWKVEIINTIAAPIITLYFSLLH